jgi:hypothetical protein
LSGYRLTKTSERYIKWFISLFCSRFYASRVDNLPE